MVNGAGWHIRLLGGFRVVRPDGSPVSFRTRKAEALVALLALHRGTAVSREDLALALWPGFERDRRLTNLRQAIAHAKAGLAPEEGISATREGCRLALDSWSCDAVEALDGGLAESALLPDFTEEVFESWRTELEALQPLICPNPAVAALPSVLTWVLSFEPARALELLHATPELAAGMPLEIFAQGLDSSLHGAAPGHPLAAWGELQLANVRMWQGEITDALAHARRAIEAAEAGGDSSTWTGAVFTAAFLMTLRGRSAKARSLIEAGRGVAASAGKKQIERRFSHALGHAAAYDGDLPSSLQVLRKTITREPEAGEESEWAFQTIHRSIYQMLHGKSEEAWLEYEAALPLARKLAHPWLDTQVALARGYNLLATRKNEEGAQVLRQVLSQAERLGSKLIEIHAVEGLALAMEGSPESHEFLIRAEALRREYGIPRLPLDELRLADLSRRG